MDVRPFQTSDRKACLALFDSLVPELIDAGRREDFEAFLKTCDIPYFVMEHDGTVVGCGGYRVFPEEAAATLHWGMIHKDFQKQGLGRFLLFYRTREVGKAGNIATLTVETPLLSAPFFEKQGFRVNAANARGIELIKKLIVCP